MSIPSLARNMLLAGALVAANPSFADPIQSEAQAAADKWDIVFNSGDMGGLSDLYTKDAIVITNDAPYTGEGIKTFFSGMKSKGFVDHKIVVNAVRDRGNTIVATGRWEVTGPGDGAGEKKKFSGNWVNVLERQNGQLRAVLHTWN